MAKIKRTHPITMRLSDDEFALLKKLAGHLPLVTWLRAMILEKIAGKEAR